MTVDSLCLKRNPHQTQNKHSDAQITRLVISHNIPIRLMEFLNSYLCGKQSVNMLALSTNSSNIRYFLLY